MFHDRRRFNCQSPSHVFDKTGRRPWLARHLRVLALLQLRRDNYTAPHPLVSLLQKIQAPIDLQVTDLVDRLPTQSASQALLDLQTAASRAVSTGLSSLDRALAGDSTDETGGYERGKIAEIWGPSGSGKTTLA